jgi:hypothetical protein
VCGAVAGAARVTVTDSPESPSPATTPPLPSKAPLPLYARAPKVASKPPGNAKACATAPTAAGKKPPAARAPEERPEVGYSPPCSTGAPEASPSAAGDDHGALAHVVASNAGFSAHTPTGEGAVERKDAPLAARDSSP